MALETVFAVSECVEVMGSHHRTAPNGVRRLVQLKKRRIKLKQLKHNKTLSSEGGIITVPRGTFFFFLSEHCVARACVWEKKYFILLSSVSSQLSLRIQPLANLLLYSTTTSSGNCTTSKVKLKFETLSAGDESLRGSS